MGSGIAAQVANAGISVSLLDLPSVNGSRNQIVENAKEKILKSRPPLLVEENKRLTGELDEAKRDNKKLTEQINEMAAKLRADY